MKLKSQMRLRSSTSRLIVGIGLVVLTACWGWQISRAQDVYQRKAAGGDYGASTRQQTTPGGQAESHVPPLRYPTPNPGYSTPPAMPPGGSSYVPPGLTSPSLDGVPTTSAPVAPSMKRVRRVRQVVEYVWMRLSQREQKRHRDLFAAIAILRDSSKDDTEEQEAAKVAIKKLLEESFEVDMRSRKRQLEELERQVAELRRSYEKRVSARDEIIQHRFRGVELDADGLGYPADVPVGASPMNLGSPIGLPGPPILGTPLGRPGPATRPNPGPGLSRPNPGPGLFDPAAPQPKARVQPAGNPLTPTPPRNDDEAPSRPLPESPINPTAPIAR